MKHKSTEVQKTHKRISECAHAFTRLCTYVFMHSCVFASMCLCVCVLIIWPFVFMHLSTKTHQRINAKMCRSLCRKNESLNSKPAKHPMPPGFFQIFLPPCMNLWLWEEARCIVLMLNTHKQLCVYMQIHAVMMIKTTSLLWFLCVISCWNTCWCNRNTYVFKQLCVETHSIKTFILILKNKAKNQSRLSLIIGVYKIL